MTKRVAVAIPVVAAVTLALIEVTFAPVRFDAERERRMRVISEYEAIRERARGSPLDPEIAASIVQRARDARRWDRTQAYAQISSIVRELHERSIDLQKLVSEIAPALRSGLSDADPYVRREAARACATVAALGALPSDLVPDLRKAAESNPGADVAVFASKALTDVH